MAGPDDEPFKGYNRMKGKARAAFIRPADPALARQDAERRARPVTAGQQGRVDPDIVRSQPKPELRMRGPMGQEADRAVANRRELEQRRAEVRRKVAEERRQQVQLKDRFKERTRE
jgi:hypothetical protein